MTTYQAIGAFVAVVGLIIGALKLAVAWGEAKQKDADHDRRIKALEEGAEEVPEELRELVAKHLEAANSESSMLRKTLTHTVQALRGLEKAFVAMKARCDAIHGPPSAVVAYADDMTSDRIEIEDANG